MMLDFRIETFLAVWNEKSYTRAAEYLFITQPAVSQHIKHLEERLGTALFRSVGRQLFLTDAGTLLYRYAAAAQAEGKKTEALIRSRASSVPLRFGATRTIGEYVLSDPLRDYLRTHPQTEVSMLVDNTDILLGKLLDGSIDFAFIEGIFDRQAFATSVFLRDRFLPLCAPGDALGRGPVELSDLFSRRLIVREHGSGSRVVLENALASLNATTGDFRHTLELGNLEVIKDLVNEGMGIAFLYERSVHKELASGRLSRIPLKDFSVFHDYSFVRLKNSVYETAYQEFLDSVLASLPPEPGMR
jgi:LysR family transcriptional regulator, transcriptional activator of the cysJI operon